MYLSFHTLQTGEDSVLLIHLMSALPANFAQLVQDVIDDHLDPYSDNYDPGFPWDSAEICVLYHGLGEQPDESMLSMPDGRITKIFNINPGHTNPFATMMEPYVRTMEVGRQALLQGETPLEAARRIWELCCQEGTITLYNPFDILTELYQLQEALLDELESNSASGGGWVC